MDEPPPTADRDIPAWGWALIIVARLWALLPLVLVIVGLWWWTSGGSEQAPKWLRKAGQHARAAADSAFGK